MNLTLPEKQKVSKRRILVYIISLAICILAVVVVIGIQVLGDDVVDNMFGIDGFTKKDEQEQVSLKANFENIFDNSLVGKEDCKVQKLIENQDIVYTNYNRSQKTDKYDMNVNLPYINIKNRTIQDFNEDISAIFEEKAQEILETTDKNIVYTVKYKAYIQNNILSLIIYSDLKQETSAQRVIIQTFNFNLEENKEISLKDILKIYDLNEQEVQNKIYKDVNEEQRKSEDLKNLGYNVFSRDLESGIYKIENIEEFFVYNGNIYVIFAYGNESITSEKDIVII